MLTIFEMMGVDDDYRGEATEASRMTSWRMRRCAASCSRRSC